ncbi:MAG: HAD family hydrolase [Pleomorphochaeta sp.]
MCNKAVIFDFNGTLFWDTEINYESWSNCIKRWLNKEYTREQYFSLNGRTTYETLEKVFDKKLDQETINKLSKEKDIEYLKIMEEEKDSLSLAPGLEELLVKLIEKDIKIAIATSAPPELMEEYEKFFSLSRFFKKELIVSSDGSLPSKPNPAIYLKAIEKLNIDASNCIVFEDTKSGIISASRANVNKIVAVNSLGADTETINNLKQTAFHIKNFKEVQIESLLDL